MPKILFVSGWYPSDETPSYGICVNRHAQAAALNNTVSVVYVHTVSSDESNIIRIKASESNNFFEIKISINKKQFIFGISSLQKAYYFMWAIVAGYFAVKKNSRKPDLVYAKILYEGGRQELLVKILFWNPFFCFEHLARYYPPDRNYQRRFL